MIPSLPASPRLGGSVFRAFWGSIILRLAIVAFQPQEGLWASLDSGARLAMRTRLKIISQKKHVTKNCKKMWHDFNRLQKVKLDSIWYPPIKFLISLLIIFHSSKNMPCQGGLDKIFVCAYTEAVQKKMAYSFREDVSLFLPNTVRLLSARGMGERRRRHRGGHERRQKITGGREPTLRFSCKTKDPGLSRHLFGKDNLAQAGTVCGTTIPAARAPENIYRSERQSRPVLWHARRDALTGNCERNQQGRNVPWHHFPIHVIIKQMVQQASKPLPSLFCKKRGGMGWTG